MAWYRVDGTRSWAVMLALVTTLASTPVASAQDVSSTIPAPCAAAIAAEPPEDSPVGHTVSVDEAHAGLLIAAGALWMNLAAAATVPKADIAFTCAEIGFTQGAVDLAAIEVRFGRSDTAKRLAAAELAAAHVEQAALATELRTRVR